MNSILEKHRIGKTDIYVPVLGIGCSNLVNPQGHLAPEVVSSVVDCAFSHSATYFDTAPYYGFGLSERRVGDETRLKPRNSFIVSTKVGQLLE